MMSLLAAAATATFAGATAWNAASAWGVAPNATYARTVANIVFELPLETIVGVNTATGASGLFTLDWTVPRDPARPLCPSPIPRFHNTTHCVTMRSDIDAYWASIYPTLEPYRRNGTLSGVFLGDERVWDGASLANLTHVTRLIRRDWPDAIIYINDAQDVLMCNFNRLNETIFGEDECWPEDLDWWGFDIYAYNVSIAYGASRAAIEANLFPRMNKASHYVVPTTDGFGGHDGQAIDKGWTLEQYDNLCTENAKAWFDYAAAEPRIAGVFPWHWVSEGGIDAPYGIGLEDMPNCRAAYEAWGARVISNVPGGKVRPHRDAPAAKCSPPPWRIDPSWSWCDTHH